MLRGELNALVSKINTKIGAAVDNINNRATSGQVRFLDTTPLFVGRRFCEEACRSRTRTSLSRCPGTRTGDALLIKLSVPKSAIDGSTILRLYMMRAAGC